MTKSRVDRPSGLKYLGFGFYFDSRAHQYKAKPHAKSVVNFMKKMKNSPVVVGVLATVTK